MTPRLITIELLGQPQGKGRPRRAPNGFHVYTPLATRLYEAALAKAARAAMAGCMPLAGALRVGVHAYFAVPQSWPRARREAALANVVRPVGKPDLDNLAKTIDAFNGIVFGDDAQVVEMVIRKVFSERPRLVIEVIQLSAIATDQGTGRGAAGGGQGMALLSPDFLSSSSSPRAAASGP